MRAIMDIPGRMERATLHGEYGDAHNGCGWFVTRRGVKLRVIFSCGEGWEHVSASHRSRTPTWEEMCEIRAYFWPDDVWVIEFHPPRAEYVNHHPYCLHLWRPTGVDFPTPPHWMVGPLQEQAANGRAAEVVR